MFSFQKKDPMHAGSSRSDSHDSDEDDLEQKSTPSTRFLDQPGTQDAAGYMKEALAGHTGSEKRRKWMPIAIGGALVLLLALISLFKAYHTSLSIDNDCGENPDQARARGCVFDVLTFCWVKPECDDKELTQEFLGLHDWKYYAHINGTEEVSLAEASLGDRQLYVTWEYHVVHCAYCYKKWHRSVLGNGYIDSHLGSYNHTKHCVMMADMEIDFDKVSVVAPLHFTSCSPVKYDVDKYGK